MGKTVQLKATDGFTLDAYVAEPEVNGLAGMIVLQEIFGVNHHIRNVTDRFAGKGYLSIAPALFDRAGKGIELPYDATGMACGREEMGKIPREKTLLDIAAAVTWLRDAGITRIGVVGYCWGGSLAWLANTQLKVDATVSYYGGMIAEHAAEKNHSPAMFHFGELDMHIPSSDWQTIREAHPDLPLYTYNADHGFNCDERDSYNAEAAKQAQERTLAFFAVNLGL